MEPESLIVIILGILLALTILPRPTERHVEGKDVDLAEGSDAEEFQRQLEMIAGH